MSLVDSNAVFKGRAIAVGLTDAVVNAMSARGWNTHANFAFAVGTQPNPDDQPFIDGVIIPILTRADHPDAPKLRRLFFESHTLTAADLRRKVESSEQEAPRKLPAPEINQRMTTLQARLNPLIIANVLEPSHQLINALVQCVEDGRVRYIDWAKCTSRSQEVNNLREDPDLKVWKPDSSGVMKAVSKDPDTKAILETELDVHNALRRRGVAYDIAQAMSFEQHEKVINAFFFELKKEPIEGFTAVTLSQIAAADRELHVRLAECTRGGLHLGPNGELPLDAPVDTILASPEIKWMLMPHPKRSAPKAEPSVPTPKKASPNFDNKRARDAKPNKSKDDLAKLKRMKRTPMPKMLVGCTPCDDEGHPFCFGYNLGTCTNNDDCPKGMHRCCKKGCGKKHSFVSAHKGGS